MLVIAVCVWLWRSACRFELRAASLPVATLMVQPYLIYYDLAWLALPMAWLAVDFVRYSSNRFENAENRDRCGKGALEPLRP
jgi:hypothetical protein